ncbi:MAG: hypothetical protein K6F07_00370 [Bacilli bacterium]|nr:hypothetical protein [Bacilli bacterium]
MEKKNKKRHLLSLLFALLGCFIMSMSLSSCGYQHASISSLLKIKRNDIVDVYFKGWGNEPSPDYNPNNITRLNSEDVDSYLNRLLKLKVWTTPETCKCTTSFKIVLDLENETINLSFYRMGNERIRYNIKDGGEQFYKLTKEYLEL